MSFDPGTIALVSGGVKAFGSILGGEGNAQAAEYNAAIARQNAAIAREQGVAAADAQWRNAERTIGAMKASFGASGIQSDNGSPLEAIMDSARMATLDNLTTKYNYELKAVGFENQATLEGMKAKTSRTSGVLNAFASMGQAYSMYKGFGGGGLTIPGFGGAEAGAGGINGWAGADVGAEMSVEEAATAIALA